MAQQAQEAQEAANELVRALKQANTKVVELKEHESGIPMQELNGATSALPRLLRHKVFDCYLALADVALPGTSTPFVYPHQQSFADPTHNILADWNTTNFELDAVPISALKAFLTSPIPCKIPINHREFVALKASFGTIVESYFEESHFQHARRLLIEVYKVLYPPCHGRAENSFISLWDSTILQPLLYISNSNFDFDRNTTDISTAVATCPDLFVTIDSMLLFRGKEKRKDSGDPKEELRAKLVWHFEGI